MTFINPYLLWGSLAIAIPVIIHFWHQKRGKMIEWAATQWLVEKNQQQQRGLKFDNLLLLLLRSLLVLLLAVLLSRPILEGLQKTETRQPVHLVQPDARLVDNFRFELEEALKKGEPVYWTNAVTEPVKSLSLPPQPVAFTALGLQTAINSIRKKNTQLHLYVLNTQQLTDVPFIYVPAQYRLHPLADSARLQRRFLTSAQTRLFVNEANRLASGPVLPSSVRFASTAAHEGVLSVLLRFGDKTERQTVRAALDALTDVYKLDLSIADQPQPGKQYDVVLADRLPTEPSKKTLYIVSGTGLLPPTQNVVFTNEPLTPQTSAVVAGGQLPEWLGETLVTYFGLNPIALPLSRQQLNALFVPTRQAGGELSENTASPVVQRGLLLFFLVLVGIERWLALTKNA